MLKNKILGKKIRNIIILIMSIAIIIGAYKFINNSRAENVLELKAVVSDVYKYLENEEITLEATQLEGNLYEIELPETVNEKIVNKIDKITVENAQYAAPTSLENPEENKIYLTKEQIQNQQVVFDISYDVILLEELENGKYNKVLLSSKTNEEVLNIQIAKDAPKIYNKILKYEDETNNKLVEVKGYLPSDAILQVEEVSKEQLTQIFGEKEIKVAYDIKILQQVETEVPVDEENPNAEPTKILETIEINPEDFYETCEVTIIDANIGNQSEVYHVKEDNSYETVNVTENSEGNVSFEAESFSVYAVTDGEIVDPTPGTEVGSHQYQTRIKYSVKNSSGTTVKSGEWQAIEYQWPEVTIPYGGYLELRSNSEGTTVFCFDDDADGECNGVHVSSYTIYDAGYYGLYAYSSAGHTNTIYNLWLTVYVATPPSVNMSQTSSSWRNSALNLTISISSSVGLSSSNSYQYYLSTSSSALAGGGWVDYANGSAFSINPESGIYYMFVKRVTDTDGAPSTSNGTDTETYHVFGPYQFDKVNPTISVSTTSCTWRNSELSTTITATDTGGSGLNSSNTYQYFLSNSPTALSGGNWTTYTNGSAIGLNPGISGTYYLFVRKVSDATGNISTANGTQVTIDGTTYQRFGAYQFDYNSPTISINTSSCTWRNSTLSLTLTVAETGGSGLYSNNAYQYFLSNSATTLSGGTWQPYTSGVAFSISPQTSGTYYLFVRRISDNAGNTSSSDGTVVTASGVSCQRFGTYQFDFDAPVWSTENLAINAEADSLTVDIVGTDTISGIAENTLSLDKIALFSDNEAITGINIELTHASTTTSSVRYLLTLSNLEEVARQVGKAYKEWSGTITVAIDESTLRDNAGNKSVSQILSLGHVDTVNPDFKYVYSDLDINKNNKTLTVVFSVADKFFEASTLMVEDLTILFDGEEPDWTTTKRQFESIKDIRAEINGEIKVIGKEYTLLLSNIQQSGIAENDNYVDYSGYVTIGIPAGKITDTSGNANKAQTITVGIDMADTIENSSGNTSLTNALPYIPENYTHVEGTTTDNGYVIQDSVGNQYVWVEVPKTTAVYQTAGLYIMQFTDAEYEKIENDLHTYTTTYRNETTNVDEYLSDTATGLTEEEYNTQKKKMLKSIYKNGGFYIGRYETGIEGTYRTQNSDTLQTPVIKPNAYSYNYVYLSQAQELSESFTANTEQYTSSLMFGVQWDLVLKYLETKGSNTTELNENSTSWGNYYDSLYNITNTSAKYSADFGASYQNAPYNKTASKEIALTTGADASFSKQNIYDFAGNMAEWTLEKAENSRNVSRSGTFTTSNNNELKAANASFRWAVNADIDNYDYNPADSSFRVALYKDEGTGSDIEDTTTTYLRPSTVFDEEGANENGLHIGDFISYDAGVWTQEEINKIQVGPDSSLVSATGTTNLPSTAFQFGGFTAGSSKNGNATVYNESYNYIKDESTQNAITGWRVFDIKDDGTVVLISAGNPEDYYHQYGANYGYISEYILTGNINSEWTNGETEAENYTIRNWGNYVNKEQKGVSATVLTKNELDSWYSKYMGIDNADTSQTETLQTIYTNESYYKYQNIIENNSYYWLGDAMDQGLGHSQRYMNPYDRNISFGINCGFGIRVLVTLSSDVQIAKTGTKTVTGGNMNTYGKEQTYNVWGIKSEDESTDAVVVDVVNPIWEKVEAVIDISEENAGTSKAVLTIRATDKYFGKSKLISENINDVIKVIVSGEEITEGISKTLNSVTLLTEEREVNGEIRTVQYGEQYTITVQGFPGNANQVKIQIPQGALIDLYDNESELTEFLLYNMLRPATDETEPTSPFLGESLNTTLYPENTTSLTPIQRQNIEKVIFVDNTAGSTGAGVKRVWDVSAQGDGSIIAWTLNSSAPYTVYIGSDYLMLANQNSSNLFAYIGYSENCTATETLSNLDILSTCLVTSMQAMFRGHGYNAMTSLNLGEEFDTHNVTNMAYMFAECGYKAMRTLNLEGKIVTTKATSMARMFMGTGYTSMTSLNLGSTFNTTTVRNMEGMFYNCGYMSLPSLDLNDNFYITNVSNMNNMFNSCGANSMTALDLGPLFTKIAYEHIDFMTGCGTSELVVYAPEQIYADINTFKINKTAQTE